MVHMIFPEGMGRNKMRERVLKRAIVTFVSYRIVIVINLLGIKCIRAIIAKITRTIR